MFINGVLGPISTSELGITLAHEHIACFSWPMRVAFGDKWLERETFVKIAVGQLTKAREQYGISTVVDATTINLGRDIRLIQEIAKKSGVNIIVSTGLFYTEEPFLNGKPVEQLAELMLYECEHGIEGTNIRPGQVKCATGAYGVNELNRNLLLLATIVHKKTNLPIFAHSVAQMKLGLLQQDEFENNGIDLSRVIIGHCGDSNDIDYLEALLKRGSYIGMDRFGIGSRLNSLENRVDTIYQLCKRGWIHKLILSHDNSAYIDWGVKNWEMTKNADYLNLEVDYTYIHRMVVPLLLAKGLSQGDINQMLIANPRNFFEGK